MDCIDNLFEFPEEEDLDHYEDPAMFRNKENLLFYALDLYHKNDFGAALFYLSLVLDEDTKYIENSNFDDELMDQLDSVKEFILAGMDVYLRRILKKNHIKYKPEDEIEKIYYKEHSPDYQVFRGLKKKFGIEVKFSF